MRISDWISDVCSSDLLEYVPMEPGFALIDFDRASRQGEPFEALIRKRQYLPNPVARGCTTSLKIRPMHRFLRHLGWTDWDQMIGIRADEQRRVSKIRARGHSTASSHETMCMPLADAGGRKRVASGKGVAVRVDLGGRRISKNTKMKRK